MAIKPSPDRTDLESKTRDDLVTIAKVKGVDPGARATKTALIEAIMSDAPAASNGDSATTHSDEPATRTVRSRRTVATPEDDFDELLTEIAGDAPAPALAPASA
ncbi:MAG: Rho termination factor N-terminal domain-containing protein, partial [Acidimicrobiales bacterium]